MKQTIRKRAKKGFIFINGIEVPVKNAFKYNRVWYNMSTSAVKGFIYNAYKAIWEETVVPKEEIENKKIIEIVDNTGNVLFINTKGIENINYLGVSLQYAGYDSKSESPLFEFSSNLKDYNLEYLLYKISSFCYTPDGSSVFKNIGDLGRFHDPSKTNVSVIVPFTDLMFPEKLNKFLKSRHHYIKSAKDSDGYIAIPVKDFSIIIKEKGVFYDKTNSFFLKPYTENDSSYKELYDKALQGTKVVTGSTSYNSFNNVKGRLILAERPVTADAERIISAVKSFNSRNGTDSYTNIITENKPYTFGVEIETSGGNLGSLSHYLNANCVRDGSIAAGEYITGPLFGDSGFAELRKLCYVLSKRTVVDRSCGVHVHLGNVSFSKDMLVYLLYLAYSIQDEIYSIMPESRGNNPYCRKIDSKIIKALSLGIKMLSSANLDKKTYTAVLSDLFSKMWNWGATGTVEEEEIEDRQELFTQEHLAENPERQIDLHIAPGARKRKTYAHPNRAIEHPGGHYTGGVASGSVRYLWINFINALFAQRKNSLNRIIKFNLKDKSQKSVIEALDAVIQQKSDKPVDNSSLSGFSKFHVVLSESLENFGRLLEIFWESSVETAIIGYQDTQGAIVRRPISNIINANVYRLILEEFINLPEYIRRYLSNDEIEQQSTASRAYANLSHEVLSRFRIESATLFNIKKSAQERKSSNLRLVSIVPDFSLSYLASDNILNKLAVNNKNINTIEFRVHSATTNYTKIKNWILICMGILFVAESKKHRIINSINSNTPITLKDVITWAYTGSNREKLLAYIELRKKTFLRTSKEDTDEKNDDEVTSNSLLMDTVKTSKEPTI